jgi:UDP-glucose 4-epimerase
MHILITGGAGFIGSNLAEYHLAQGHRIHVVDDLSTGAIENIEPFMDNPDFHFDHDDILTWDGLETTINWADRIYHLAAVVGVFRVLEDPVRVMSINIAATERILKMAHANSWRPQILLASTSEVYGHGLQCRKTCVPETTDLSEIGDRRHYRVEEFREDMEPMVGSSAVSRWNYSISKLADEALGLSYARQYGSPIVVARFFNTIGPRQRGRYGMVVPRFINQAISGAPLTVFGDGKQMRSFCDVRDTVASLNLLMDNPDSHGHIVNVGSNREVSILELADLIRSLANSSSVIDFISYEDAYQENFEETFRRKPNLDKFFRLTNYKHKWTLEDTIQDLIATKRK